MSIQALNWALAQDQIENSATRFVLLVLCNYANEKGICYPSRATIAKKTSLSVRSVQDHLNWLSENGYLSWEHSRNGQNQGSNIYQIQSAGFALSGISQGEPVARGVCKSEHSQGEPVAHNDTSEETKEIRKIYTASPPEPSYSPPILKPKDRDLVFIEWFDAIAKAMGAKNRFGLTRQAKWKEVVLACMSEGYQPSELVTVIDATLSDPKFEMKYFSPEKTLDELRLQKRPKAHSSKLQSAAEKIAADEADRQNIIRPPVQRVS